MNYKTQILADHMAKGLPSWESYQCRRLQECIDSGMTIAYWNSDADGMPVNHDIQGKPFERAQVGVIHEVSGPLKLCSEHALHATFEPHKWKGSRFWVVALHGEVKSEGDKVGSLKREILGEVMLEDSWIHAGVSLKLGAKELAGENISDLYFPCANFSDVNFCMANLSGAYIVKSKFVRVNLINANVSNANISMSNFCMTDFSSANFSGSDISNSIFSDIRGICVNFNFASITGASFKTLGKLSEALIKCQIKRE